MFEGTDSVLKKQCVSWLSCHNYQSFKNSYCDHRNFDSVNWPAFKLQQSLWIMARDLTLCFTCVQYVINGPFAL
jgi:hypothetical protein